MEILNVRTQQDLILSLESVSKGANAPKTVHIDESLFSVTVKLFEGDEHSIISSQMMEAFLAYEQRIVNSYKILKYGSLKAKITDEEKELLKLKVEVKDGCTEQKISNLKEILKLLSSLYDNMLGDMSPKQKFRLFAGIMILGMGYLVTDSVKHVSDNSLKQAETEANNKLLDNVVTRALQQNEETERLLADSIRFERALNKGLKGVDRAEIQGKEVYAPPIKQSRSKAVVINKRLDGYYAIKNFDFDKDTLKAKIESQKTEQSFNADFDSLIKNDEHQLVFLEHAVNKKYLYLYVNATFNGSKLKEAVIVDYSLTGADDPLSPRGN